MIRVLLVEDHTSFRQALGLLIAAEPDMKVVGQAGSLAEARTVLQGADVAVIDLDLSDGSGLDLISDVREINPHGAVLVLTGSESRIDLARAVEEGAAGVLHKSASIEEIVAAVRRVSEGEHLISPRDAIELMRYAIQQREQNREAQLMIAQLTARERDVLQALAEGLSDKEISQRLHVGVETVRSHMGNILAKLGVESRLQALIFAIRHGAVHVS